MIRSSNEKDFPAKREGDANDGKHPKGPSSSRPWSSLKDPRIVRVSRTFGGKDRHSKVCTIRGLRDRRVRLSVQTAIQLYDLQDRLGLNQPSKVVDWLLTAAQEDIDKLPPLQMLPEHFVQYPQPVMVSHEATPSQVPSLSFLGAKSDYEKSNGTHLWPSKEHAKASNGAFGDEDQQNMFPKSSTYWNSDASSKAKSKEVHSEVNLARSYWMKRDEHHDASQVHGAAQMLPTHNPFPRPNLTSLPSLLNNTTPYPSYYHLELSSNSSVAHFLGHGYSSQTEEINNCNSMSMPSPLPPPSGSQLLLYPSVSTPSIFPQFVSSGECDPKQISHIQMLSSTPQSLLGNPIGTSLYSINPTMRPFHVNITPIYHQSQNSHEVQSNALHKPTIGAASSAVTTNAFQSASKATTTLGSTQSSFM